MYEYSLLSDMFILGLHFFANENNFWYSGTAVFWVIGASFFVIGLHASFYNFDALDLPLDDTQKLTGQIIEEV